MKGMREHLEARVGECVDRDDVAGVERGHDGDGQAVLRTVDDEDPVRVSGDSPAPQVPCDRGSVLGTPPMWLVAQQRVDITGGGQLSQGLPKEIGLPGQRRIVEVEVDRVRGDDLLIDAVTGGNRDVTHERPAALFPAHQAHRFQLGVHPGRGHHGDALTGGEPAVCRQPHARGEPPGPDVGCERVDQDFVPRAAMRRIVRMTIL